MNGIGLLLIAIICFLLFDGIHRLLSLGWLFIGSFIISLFDCIIMHIIIIIRLFLDFIIYLLIHWSTS